MNYLYAAFTATWVIHILYLISVARGYAQVKKELSNLDQQR